MPYGKDNDTTQKPDPSHNPAAAKSLSLPKGGGAIRGIGEKFAANPVTGTGSLSIPIFTSPGRSGFGPQLSLSYDSGSGNGPFGMGWSLSLASISRKTEKGLPQYRDAEESDVFIIPGADDLVPVLNPDGSRFEDDGSVPGYLICRYRPRIEGLFHRIERWTRRRDDDVHWRSLSKENVLTIYGQDDNSRLSDPDDPRRVFSWLACETRDPRGNAVVYRYQEEDAAGVDLARVCERNRGEIAGRRRSANRYLKQVLYGNRRPLLDEAGERPPFLPREALDQAGWMFEVILDYGEHDALAPTPQQTQPWSCRRDPFSSYRSGFEIRSYRLCRRVLMFHHFEEELGAADCLVRSTDFRYQENSIASFITELSQSGYLRNEQGGYLRSSMPPLEFQYSQAIIREEIREIYPKSLGNLPSGSSGSDCQWVDLDGEGLTGIFFEQAGAWFYKPNTGKGSFGPLQREAPAPSLDGIESGETQLLDLSGDGQLDLVAFNGPPSGFFERTEHRSWRSFTSFAALPNLSWDDPNLRFVDLTGDGHTDLLITEDEILCWYPSLAERGFAPGLALRQALDEEQGPRLLFSDPAQSIHLSDLSGDGLSDLVRIRNGEVCYWPNLGYGRFGAKVTMDHSPLFDRPDLFDQKRLLLADIDGSGTTDLIYLEANRAAIYRNACGNSFALPQYLDTPALDNLSSVLVTDLMGNGTACLVWSSPLPGDAGAPLRYIDLMGGVKPHLLVRTVNNLGAETSIHYAPSTSFYLADQAAGTPWITRLPFPVQVVDRIETLDRISRNRFVTRYAYHHGYFDGWEREFRGFGLVEQWDSEQFGAFSASGELPAGEGGGVPECCRVQNIAASSFVPPVLTKTWFHTGLYLGRDHVSDFYAGAVNGRDRGEYYREPAWADDDAKARRELLPDTVLPAGLTPEEEREACRALKGAMLRQEVYALDGSAQEKHPYTVTEQNATVRVVQRRGHNRHAVCFSHPREALNYHYERNPEDPRLTQTLTFEVDDFGNTLRTVSVGYRRREVSGRLPEQGEDHLRLSLQRYANFDERQWRRIGVPVESRSYEVARPPESSARFDFNELRALCEALVPPGQSEPAAGKTIPFEEWDWSKRWQPHAGPGGTEQTRLRLTGQERTLYRPDDLGASLDDPLALLPLGAVQSLALTGESYQLAFTAGLLSQVYRRPHRDGSAEALIPEPAALLGGGGGERGGYLDLDGDGCWWLPGGRVFLSPGAADSAREELLLARRHFFLPRRYRDPFHSAQGSTESSALYDVHDLVTLETRDPLGNTVSAVTRDDQGVKGVRVDYRVLQPYWITGPNGNRTQVAYDALGFVVGTAVMGKPLDGEGDSLAGFLPDLPQELVIRQLADPLADPLSILGRAGTRTLYDRFAYYRTRDQRDPRPSVAYTLSRESHAAEGTAPDGVKLQLSFSYSDGFGREIQKKLRAEPGPVPLRDSNGDIVIGADGQPRMTQGDVSPRWVGSGWTVFNNKKKPVRSFEPFFSDSHRFEFRVAIGVSPVFFYDPVGRPVATIHPDHSWEKTVSGPWRQEIWDANDTVRGDPRRDPDVAGFVAGYFQQAAREPEPWQTWLSQRGVDPLAPPLDTPALAPQQKAALRTLPHADTPTLNHFDTLGRPFLTQQHNGFRADRTPVLHPIRVTLDLESNQREVRDAIVQNGDPSGRLVTRYDFDLLGRRLHQAGMEAGERWMLDDAAGKPLAAWDSRGHASRHGYDPLRRPLRCYLTGADPSRPGLEILTERLVYGEQHPEGERRNLRGKLYLHFDQAGVMTNESRDFKGNLQHSSRRLAKEYRRAADWGGVDANPAALPPGATEKIDTAALLAALAPLLEEETYASRTRYDALNRPIQLIAPHSGAAGSAVNVIEPLYNEANLLEQVHAWLNRDEEPTGWLDPAHADLHAVTGVRYNARGERTRIDYANTDGKVLTTSYVYDPKTFRLVRLTTRRGVDPMGREGTSRTGDRVNPQEERCGGAAPETAPEEKGRGLQNLSYSHDPSGNIVEVRDRARQTVYFDGQVVPSLGDYSYDAMYRLICATGREHPGQVGHPETDWSDAPRERLPLPGSGQAMRNYRENYHYDAVGNLERLVHRAQNGSWTRSYAYREPSGTEPGKTGNRLSSTALGAGPAQPYRYDPHGNITGMPHLSLMQWDYRDQLQASARQLVREGTPETTYYVYDAAGQRVRKVTETALGQVKDERVYLGGFEIYRRLGVGALRRETLHIMDDRQRIALVETRTDAPAKPGTVRYQLGNHLGSASLELDERGRLISFEEYYPFGSTSCQAVASQTEAPKRYRLTGKERDEESGFYYFGARYYAAWLGRWLSADPAGIADGVDVYAYARNSPVVHVDLAGTDTKTVQKTDNYSQLLRQALTQEKKKIPAEDALKKELEDYLQTYQGVDKTRASDPVFKAFKAKMDLSGKVTVKLKDFKPAGWEDAGGDPEACFKLACSGAGTTTSGSDTVTGGGGVILYEAVARRIKTDKTASDLALLQIKRHIDSGRSLVAGVNEPATSAVVDKTKQPVTDHFVAVYGYETDSHGNVKSLFAKDNAVAGAAEVKFIVAADGSITKPKEKRSKGQEYLEQEYQLSEVRFHSSLPYTGDLKPRDDANQIMYWPHGKDDKDK